MTVRIIDEDDDDDYVNDDKFEDLFKQISDLLEGGDVIEDHIDDPWKVAMIQSVGAIVGLVLTNIEVTRQMQPLMKEMHDALTQSPENFDDSKPHNILWNYDEGGELISTETDEGEE